MRIPYAFTPLLTTREKLFDSEVPPFKVRLFNIVGAREYELPTGDTLGAIMYESGPDAAMDFDIIIEQRTGPPQRVNKLHPSYMALQFPLLFVYGEDGYSKDMKIRRVPGASSDEDRQLTMKTYYSSACLHSRTKQPTSMISRVTASYVGNSLSSTRRSSSSGHDRINIPIPDNNSIPGVNFSHARASNSGLGENHAVAPLSENQECSRDAMVMCHDADENQSSSFKSCSSSKRLHDSMAICDNIDGNEGSSSKRRQVSIPTKDSTAAIDSYGVRT
nr:helitron helicase-like domain-containing protein [Tanacetum cinerariifolium]